MAQDNYRLLPLAGDFPPGLNSSDPAHKLEIGETPDGYGYDLSTDGVITKGTVPSGTARVSPTVTLTESALSIPYLWYYNRLWNITGRTVSTASNVLIYSAPYYQQIFYPQGLGKIPLDEDAQTILALLPVEPDGLFVAKSTGGYLISNLSDGRGFFQRSEIMQEMATPAANQVVEIDSSVFVNNSSGVTMLRQGQTAEISRKIRGETLTPLAVTADYSKRRVIFGSTHVYDVAAERWFKYSGSSFRFTTRQLTSPDWAPFAVDRAVFVLEHTGTSDGQISYALKLENDAWTNPIDRIVPYSTENYTFFGETLASRRSVRRFQMRISELTGLKLREILVNTNAKQADDYAS